MFPTGRTATVAWAEEELGCETKLCYFTTLGRLSTEPASEKPRRKVFVSNLDGGVRANPGLFGLLKEKEVKELELRHRTASVRLFG